MIIRVECIGLKLFFRTLYLKKSLQHLITQHISEFKEM